MQGKLPLSIILISNHLRLFVVFSVSSCSNSVSTLICPFSGVNLKALDNRLIIIFSTLSWSNNMEKEVIELVKVSLIFFFSDRSEKSRVVSSRKEIMSPSCILRVIS